MKHSKTIFQQLCFLPILVLVWGCSSPTPNRPNIILVMADDMGYGDLGIHGNELISTPAIDKFAEDHLQFTHFYVSTVCAPTRASLMTGKYNYRTGVLGVHPGQHLMKPQEVTIAEILKQNGYVSGIFGKWHLGDNYPMRAIDQGFDEAVVHLGGGMALPVDFPGNSYFDPYLMHNGKKEKYQGYCADIFTQKTIEFMAKNRDQPFFAYLAPNTPHLPALVDKKYSDPYVKKGLSDKEAKVYGMVTNFDDNFQSLISAVDSLGLAEKTIIIFMSDNGPDFNRPEKWNAGLRGDKGTPFDGGLRVPFFMKLPGVSGPQKIKTQAAHIDILPTLLDLCGIQEYPQPIDGISLRPLLEGQDNNLADRKIFNQWHVGESPQRFKGSATYSQAYKLVQPNGGGFLNRKEGIDFQLYNIKDDPGERTDLSDSLPQVVGNLKLDYENWFAAVTSDVMDYTPCVTLDRTRENPVLLSKFDLLRSKNGNGKAWMVRNTEKFTGSMALYFDQMAQQGDSLVIEFLNHKSIIPLAHTGKEQHLNSITLERGTGWLHIYLSAQGETKVPRFANLQIK